MLKSKQLRLVIDTNLWISFIISKKLNSLDALLYSNRIRLLFSVELIQEIEASISKPKLEKYFEPNSILEMLTLFEPFIDLVKVKSIVKVSRDHKDDFLLALSKDGKADYLLTGDHDLLILEEYGKTKILTLKEFLKNNR